MVMSFTPCFVCTGGLCFAYNCDLYYQYYFPDYDLGWWLFAVTIVVGSIGVVFGGIVSDKFVAKMGVRSRVAVLAISQVSAHFDFSLSCVRNSIFRPFLFRSIRNERCVFQM
jgi:MFS family permease